MERAMMVPRPKGLVMSTSERFAVTADFYRYACAESSVGRLLVVMTQNGVVDVIWGDCLKQMLSAAMARHHEAGFIPDRGEHAQWVAAVVKRIEMPCLDLAAPLDLDPGGLCRAKG